MNVTPEPVVAGPIHSVTLIAPMRNEVRNVDAFVRDIAAQDFGGPIDVVVADGGSTDGSAAALVSAAKRDGVRLTLIDNPLLLVSHALNLCVARADGDLVVRLDLHSQYPPDYVRLLVETAERSRAWNVGGIVVPNGTTPTERAVAAAMDSPFGGIGWTRAAGHGGPVEVDTVTFGAFRPAVFDVVGGFDETLVRNQDDEFNLRLRRAGGTIVLDPRVVVHYIPRGTVRGVFRQYFEYGAWKVPVMLKHRRVLGIRSLVPAGFVATLVVTAALSPWFVEARLALAGVVCLYATGALTAGMHTIRRRRESIASLPRVIGAYLAFHLGYGAGMLSGAFRPQLLLAGDRSPRGPERVDRQLAPPGASSTPDKHREPSDDEARDNGQPSTGSQQDEEVGELPR